jgi:hypothetical protein
MPNVLQRLQSLALGLATLGVAALVYVAEQPKAVPAAGVSEPPSPTPTSAITPSRPSSLWIGDAFTAGVGAADQAHAESCLTAKAMGWTCHVDAESGTGFLSNGQVNSSTFAPVGQRLSRDAHRFDPDVVIVDAGRTDVAFPPASLKTAVDSDLKSIQAAWPQAQLVLIAPYFMNSDAEPLGAPFVAFLHTEAAKYHGSVVDPIGAGWINSATTGAMTIANHVDPNPAGHHYIAQHLAADFRTIPKLAHVGPLAGTG